MPWKITITSAQPPRERSQPPFFTAPEPECETDGDEAHHHAGEPVGVLGEFGDIGQPAFGIDGAVRERPIGKGHACADARGKCAQRDQQKDPNASDGGKNGESRFMRGCAWELGSEGHEQSNRRAEAAMLLPANPLTIFSASESLSA